MRNVIRFITRWFVDIAVFIVVIVAAVVVVYRVALPGWVEGQVRELLAERGLPDARFELTRVSLGGAELTALQLGDDAEAFAAKRVALRFNIVDLLFHQVDGIAIDGLRWRITYADGAVDLGPVGTLLAGTGGGGGGGDEPATDGAPAASIDRIVVEDIAITDSVIELQYAGRVWQLPVGTATPAPAEGDELYTVRFDRAGNALVINAPVAPMQSGSLVAAALKQEANLSFAGRAGASLRIGLDGEASAMIELDRVTATYGKPNPTSAYELHDLTGTVRFDSLSPLTTPPGQQLTWSGAQLGELMMDRGLLRFAIEGPESIHIERLRTDDPSGGQYRVMSVRFDPAKPDVSADLFVENFPLGGVLDTLSFGQASGDGRMAGRVPIRIATQPRLRIAFGSGVLAAQTSGTLSVTRADLVDAIMQQSGLAGDGAGGGAGDGNTDYAALVRQRLVQALQDLQYSQLSFVTHQKDGSSVLTVNVAGKGRTSGQEVNLTVNINDYDDGIDLAIRSALGLQQAGDEALRRAFGGE